MAPKIRKYIISVFSQKGKIRSLLRLRKNPLSFHKEAENLARDMLMNARLREQKAAARLGLLSESSEDAAGSSEK